MIKTRLIINVILISLMLSCQETNGQSSTLLNVTEFAEKIKTTKDAQILDVRTPQEFAESHLQKAININWNGNDFLEKVQYLDKEKPLFVYCLGGGRSGAASAKLKELGFKNVFDMQGGIAKWKASKLPLEITQNSKNGLSEKDFQKILTKKDLVLIDFNATWCAPCRKLKPILEKIGNENKNIAIVAIDYDENTEIVEKYKVEAVPMLMLFKKGEKVWENKGFLNEEKIKEAIKMF
jgi:thioredoxin